jgi:MFS family permease
MGTTYRVYADKSDTFATFYNVAFIVGLCLGSLTVKFLCNRYGRKTLMIVSACILLVGTGMVKHSQNIVDDLVVTYFGRVIDGFGCGIGSAVAPIYSRVSLVKEVTPAQLCGKYGGLSQVFLTLGVFTAVSFPEIEDNSSLNLKWWQVEYLIFIALILVQIGVFVLFLPESQHWDYLHGNRERAAAVSRRIYINPGNAVDRNLEVQRENQQKLPYTRRRIVTSLRNVYSVMAYSFNIYAFAFYIISSNNYFILSAEMASLVVIALVILFSDRKIYAGFNRKLMFAGGACALNCIAIVFGVLIMLGFHLETLQSIFIPPYVLIFMGTVGPFFWIYMPELLKINELSYPMICLWSTQLVMMIVFYAGSSPSHVFLVIFPSLSLFSAGLIFRIGIETRGVNWADSSDTLMTDESD